MDPISLIHKVLTAISLALAAINSIPAHDWYIIGTLIGSGIAASTALAWITYSHKYRTAEKMAKHIVSGLLSVLSAGFAVSSYFLTNSQSLNLPLYLGASYGIIYTVATKFYQLGGNILFQKVAGAVFQWANDKANPKKSIFSTSPKLKTPAAVPDTEAVESSIFS